RQAYRSFRSLPYGDGLQATTAEQPACTEDAGDDEQQQECERTGKTDRIYATEQIASFKRAPPQFAVRDQGVAGIQRLRMTGIADQRPRLQVNRQVSLEKSPGLSCISGAVQPSVGGQNDGAASRVGRDA